MNSNFHNFFEFDYESIIELNNYYNEKNNDNHNYSSRNILLDFVEECHAEVCQEIQQGVGPDYSFIEWLENGENDNLSNNFDGSNMEPLSDYSYNSSNDFLSSSITSSKISEENEKFKSPRAKRGRPLKYTRNEDRKAAAKIRHSKDRLKRKEREANEKLQQDKVGEIYEALNLEYSKVKKTNNLLLEKYLQNTFISPDLKLIWNEPDEIPFHFVQLKKLKNDYCLKITDIEKEKNFGACKRCREKKRLSREKAKIICEILGNMNILLPRYINEINSKNSSFEKHILETKNNLIKTFATNESQNFPLLSETNDPKFFNNSKTQSSLQGLKSFSPLPNNYKMINPQQIMDAEQHPQQSNPFSVPYYNEPHYYNNNIVQPVEDAKRKEGTIQQQQEPWHCVENALNYIF